jgi:hypothetical protein
MGRARLTMRLAGKKEKSVRTGARLRGKAQLSAAVSRRETLHRRLAA